MYFLYVPIIFLIAGRFGSLLQLIHEASHTLLSPDRKTNDRLAKWLCSLPVGVFYEGYVTGHMLHHAWTNTDKDPKADTEKYRLTDFKDPALYLLLLKDLLGITALSIFFAYKESNDSSQKTKESKVVPLLQLCLVQSLLLGGLFQFDIVHYILFWLFPAVSPHMFLMRIRGIAEHGLSKQLNVEIKSPSDGNFYTRSFFTKQNHYSVTPLIWIEKLLIGSLNVNHHHEHHLFPTVPFYNLPILHERIAPLVHAQNPDIYAKGYFAAAFRSLTQPLPQSRRMEPVGV